MARNILIIGASRGLGDALAKGLPETGDRVWLVARGEPRSLARADGVVRTWIQADLNEPAAPTQIHAALGDTSIDLLVKATLPVIESHQANGFLAQEERHAYP